MKQHHVCCLFLAFCLFLFSCSPQKRIQKYSYLFDSPSSETSLPSSEASAHIAYDEYEDAPSSVPKRPARIAGTLSKRDTERIIKTALKYQGTPYKYGGMSRKGMDCSGLVCLAYQSIDRQLPHSSQTLLKSGKKIRKDQLQPGHLVFFSAKNGNKIDHVGLVSAVQGKHIEFVHASVSGGVRVDRLDEGYWMSRFRQGVAL